MDLKIKKTPVIIIIFIIVLGSIVKKYINIDSLFSGENSMFLFAIIIAGILLCVGAYFFLKDVLENRVYDKIETVPVSSHSVVCGGRFGWYNLTTPFVKLDICEDFLLIRFPFNRIQLNKNSIVKIQKTSEYLSQGIEIIHTRNDLISQFILWVPNADALLSKLKEFGF